MRIKTVKRRLRTSGVCEREIHNVYKKMKGMPDHECKPGGKFSKEWAKAVKEMFIYD